MTNVPPSSRRQCEARTSKGRQCRNPAGTGSRFCAFHQNYVPGPAKPKPRRASLVDQAASLGASKPITAHKAWRRIQEMRAGDRHLLAAGVSADGKLVVVTELAIYIAQRLLFFTICEKYLHEQIERYRVRGLLGTKLRLHIGRRTTVDVPSMLTETSYPVHTAIAHVWHTRTLEPVLRKIIAPHVKTLARKRSQLLARDDYGAEDRRAWDREIERFFMKVVEPRLPEESTDADRDYLLVSFGLWVDGFVDEWLAERPEGITGD